jgi:hypothetical protein
MFKEFEYTKDGYIISPHGQYIGLKNENEFDWYGDIELTRQNLKPIINMNVLNEIRDYIKSN